MSKYSPISLLTPFSKILERVLFNGLFQHLRANMICKCEQFGFRKECTIDSAVFTLTNNIY
jgi:hypothetical protein